VFISFFSQSLKISLCTTLLYSQQQQRHADRQLCAKKDESEDGGKPAEIGGRGVLAV